jgi:hypothetical protein
VRAAYGPEKKIQYAANRSGCKSKPQRSVYREVAMAKQKTKLEVVGVVYKCHIHDTPQRRFSVPRQAVEPIGLEWRDGTSLHVSVETEPGRVVFAGNTELTSGTEVDLWDKREILEPRQQVWVTVSRSV